MIVAGTAFALWRIMGSDFSSVGSGGLRTPKKKTKKKQDAKNVHIYYGSQTGTAETFSKEIKKGCEKLLDERAQVWDMEDFEPDEFIKQKVVVMCLATFENELNDILNFSSLIFFALWQSAEVGLCLRSFLGRPQPRRYRLTAVLSEPAR